ncbi:hypothetical protein, conserved [Leishmania tarentolae]|uniref:Uncharacterized protein n=1 Tax=Leishmania tarentolae TaxID=5689 RepID=A0A640KR70_LEITA|nr:hypothetical protein, conserved [Leishmania tarentolae]
MPRGWHWLKRLAGTHSRVLFSCHLRPKQQLQGAHSFALAATVGFLCINASQLPASFDVFPVCRSTSPQFLLFFMHQLSTFNYVASELGHDEPVLHAVFATHRCLPPDPPEAYFKTTSPQAVTAASCRASRDDASVEADGHVENTIALAAEDMLAAPLEATLTVEQELAKLNKKLDAWKVQRLSDLRAPEGERASSRLAQMQAEMERRLMRRRIEEQDRTQRRMNALLNYLGPRIDEQLQRIAREQDSEKAPSSSTANVEKASEVKDSACAGKGADFAATQSPPCPGARILCDQQYFVARQEIALMERDARQALMRSMWDARRLAHLVEDEVSFRQSIESSEVVWRDRLLHSESHAPEEVDDA